MIFGRHRLGRRFFLEFEFYAASVAIGWAALAYGTQTDMTQRPSLAALGGLSDDQWATFVGGLGAIQMGCVLGNTRWGRWLVAIPLCTFWCAVSAAILCAGWRGESVPLSAALYAGTAVCMILKVASLPREFPPRG